MRRAVVTAAFLAAMAAYTRWTPWFDAVESRTSYEISWLVVLAPAGIVGFIEGRWWVLVLAPLTWLLVWIPGMTDEERGYTLVFGVPATLIGLVLGVSLRVAGRALIAARRSSGPP